MQGLTYVLIMFWCGVVGGIIGRMKGSSFFMWFLISACVPVLGVIVALCYRWDGRELRRACPDCGRVLKLHDAVCTNCGAELEFPEVALAPAHASSRQLRSS